MWGLSLAQSWTWPTVFKIFSSCGGFYPICPILLKVTRVLVAAKSPFSIDFANTCGDLAATQPGCVFERE